MRRRFVPFTLVLAAAFPLAALPSAAQDAAQREDAAKLATQKARAVTLTDLSSGSNVGTVRLERIGSTRTRVTIHFATPHRGRSVVTLHRGSDCSDPRYATQAQSIALNPVDASQQSQTIVDLPLTDLQSGNYLLDVRNATQARQFAQACARIKRGR